MTTTYSPTPGTFGHTVCSFFKANPEEALTRSDIADKFSVDAGGVDTRLATCVQAQLLTCGNDSELGKVWRAGPELAKWASTAGNTKRGGTRVLLPRLCVAALKVGTVPMPETSIGKKGSTRHDEVLDQLTADGMSVTGIPIAYQAALAKAAAVYLDARPDLKRSSQFFVRRLSDTECGVWRVARTAEHMDALGRKPRQRQAA